MRTFFLLAVLCSSLLLVSSADTRLQLLKSRSEQQPSTASSSGTAQHPSGTATPVGTATTSAAVAANAYATYCNLYPGPTSAALRFDTVTSNPITYQHCTILAGLTPGKANSALTVTASNKAVAMGSYDQVFAQSQQNIVFTYADPSANWVLFAPVISTRADITANAVRFFVVNVASGTGPVDLFIDDIPITAGGVTFGSAMVRDLLSSRGAMLRFKNTGSTTELARLPMNTVPAPGTAVVVALTGKKDDKTYPLTIFYHASSSAALVPTAALVVSMLFAFVSMYL